MSFNLTYLACPYTHANMDIRIQRFHASARAAAFLIHRGKFVYSPITMTHPIDLIMAKKHDTMGSDYWCNFDEAFMQVCKEMIILTISGWKESKGIQREIDFFRTARKPICLIGISGDTFVLENEAYTPS